MKKISLLILGTLLIICESTKTEGRKEPKSYKICPICGMVRDSSWMNYTIYKNDTVWFCSTSDRADFINHPKKYASELK